MALKLEPTPAFANLCEGLHQDALKDASTAEELAVNCLDFVRTDQRDELTSFLEYVLAKGSPAEIRRLINQCPVDLTLSPKGARLFVEAVLLAIRTQAAEKKAENRARPHSYWRGHNG